MAQEISAEASASMEDPNIDALRKQQRNIYKAGSYTRPLFSST
jgi:hypothetical protein